MALQTIPVEQLQVGHYIRLDGSWRDYPFLFRSFKIKNKQQIETLLDLGLETISYDPDRSKIRVARVAKDAKDARVAKTEKPRSQKSQSSAKAEVHEEVNDQEAVSPGEAIDKKAAQEAYQERARRLEESKERRLSQHRCEKAFKNSVSDIADLMGDMRAQPKETLKATEKMVGDIVGDVMTNKSATMQLVTIKGQDKNTHHHLANITMLSLIVGRELGLSDDEMQHLGAGAMLHDLGKMKIQERIVQKRSPLSEIEQRTYKQYPEYGAKLAKKYGSLPKEVIEIIEQHREQEDGTGYPNQLESDEISKLSKIVAITTAYNDHCNSPMKKKLLTPYEAMSLMYSQTKFDENILSIFINRLGVYPPGTLVKLSDGSYAGVTGMNHDDLLNPQVVIFDADVPKNEAEIIELSEIEDLNIEEAIRRNEAPEEMIAYLDFGGSLNYFLDPSVKEPLKKPG